LVGEDRFIRRIVLVASIVSVGFAIPRALFAAPNLALPHSDYPSKSRVAVLPATNSVTNRYFGPVHRSSFDALHRIDGAGWVQAAVWHFSTGKGGARRTHQTIFAYAINVYSSKKRAQTAVKNVKIKTTPYRVSRIYCRLYQHIDGRETLVFLFFSFRSIEVESYYEYTGTAPAKVARSLRSLFNRQASHLAGVARKLHRSIVSPPPPPLATATPEASATPTATDIPPTATATVTATVPAATATATAVPPTPTTLPSPTPTATPVPLLALTAWTSALSYAPGASAEVTVKVMLGASPVSGAQVSMTLESQSEPDECDAITDSSGSASCTFTVPPDTPDGSSLSVSITVHTPYGAVATTRVTFLVT
jgi:hypothetical protein